MGIIRIRLAPSGAPVDGGLVIDALDEAMAARVSTMAYNTVLYRAPVGALGRIEGPALENPAQLGLTIPAIPGAPTINVWRLWAQLTQRVTVQAPGGPAPLSYVVNHDIQVQRNSDGWGVPKFIYNDPVSNNGTSQIDIVATSRTQDAFNVALCAEHVAALAAGDIMQMRARWAQQGDYADVLSSFANESLGNGGWHFEMCLGLVQLGTT